MKRNMKQTKTKKTLAEELSQYREWLYERDLDVGDVVRRMVAVAVGMVGGALSILAWALMVSALNGFFRDGHWSWIVLALGTGGMAVLVCCGVLWLVWAIWTDEL